MSLQGDWQARLSAPVLARLFPEETRCDDGEPAHEAQGLLEGALATVTVCLGSLSVNEDKDADGATGLHRVDRTADDARVLAGYLHRAARDPRVELAAELDACYSVLKTNVPDPEHPLQRIATQLLQRAVFSDPKTAVETVLLPLLPIFAILLECRLRTALASADSASATTATTPAPAAALLLRDILLHPLLATWATRAERRLAWLLVGPPTGLNLRNLLWHGFITHSTPLPWTFWLILPLLVARWTSRLPSLPPLLAEAHVQAQLDAMQLRPGGRAEGQLQRCLAALPALTSLLPALTKVHPWELTRTLLCRIEVALRARFARANDCPERVLCAEEATLFTTLDVVLAPKHNEHPNTLYANNGSSSHALPMALSLFLFDMFLAPEGPRLRDKVAHGLVATLRPSHLCALGCVLATIETCSTAVPSPKWLATYVPRHHPLGVAVAMWHALAVAEQSGLHNLAILGRHPTAPTPLFAEHLQSLRIAARFAAVEKGHELHHPDCALCATWCTLDDSAAQLDLVALLAGLALFDLSHDQLKLAKLMRVCLTQLKQAFVELRQLEGRLLVRSRATSSSGSRAQRLLPLVRSVLLPWLTLQVIELGALLLPACSGACTTPIAGRLFPVAVDAACTRAALRWLKRRLQTLQRINADAPHNKVTVLLTLFCADVQPIPTPTVSATPC
ncbi:uncharacterized protein MONBRDRAFT_37142 [Monosiga brevicollis MX1]|uniref:DUF4209 domain-containing protein n=1 Tax=Monosiga brevicollis TaxID=81824 RepID=A9UZU9_MONBE|nr:uncharacterized protein MONBRDRAFT_37142 [Monosiga brevicollis MX1]EDQ89427.1 predicted protein [Monosiga brevicollis MX1]|eukprot:XP_001746003.1 hypothetical protein [Monosiga brevicollis MX1]